MPRTIDPALLAVLSSKSVSPFYAVEMFFDSGVLRIWTGSQDSVINGFPFIGAASLLEIQDAEETADLSAKTFVVTLSGTGTDLISLAIQEPFQNRLCKIYLGETTVNQMVEIFSGGMDRMTIDDDPSVSKISITVESTLVILNRTKVRRYNNESHISRYPGDTFFSRTADLQDRRVTWGRTER